MPKPRLLVEGIPPTPLRPAASPVNTFEQTKEGQQLEQLAQGLATLSPALGRFSDVLAKRSAEENFAAGQKKARELSESAASFRDAIKAGKITPNQSPWFMSGLKEQFGRLAADRMNFEFLTAAAQDEGLQNSTDAADFDAFYHDFRSKWMQQNLEPDSRDPQFENGFGARTDAYLADNQRAFAAQLAGRVPRMAGDAHFAEVMNGILTEQGRGVTPEMQGTAISQLIDIAVQNGQNGALINRKTVDAVVAAAQRLNDPTVLNILDNISTGPVTRNGKRATLSTTSYGAAKIEEAQHNIATEIQVRNNRDWSEHQRVQAAAVDNILQDTWNALEASNGSADLTTFRSRMSQADPKSITTLYQMRDAYNDHTLVDDPPMVASAFRRVNVIESGESYTTMEEASALLSGRHISIPNFRTLVNDIQERDKVGVGRWSQDPVLKQGTSDMERMFGVEFGQTGENPNAVRLAIEAKDEFTVRYIQWRKGPGAQVEDAVPFTNKLRNEIFNRMTNRAAAVDYSRIPHANLSPQPMPPKKGLVTDPSNIRSLQTDLEQWTQGKRSRLTTQSLDLLKRYGVPTNVDSIQTFLNDQKKFLEWAKPVIVEPPPTPEQ